MAFADLFGKKKHHKETDKNIDEAKKFMAAGDFQKADDILWEVYLDFSYKDPDYRKSEIEDLLDQCKAGLEQQKEQEKAEKLAEKDRLIEEIKAVLKGKNWQKAIQLLDVVEENYDINHRSNEMEDLCIEAQEVCFDSDGVNDWSDAVYSKMYMRKKGDYIKLARELADEGNISFAKDTLFLLDRKYNSGYMDDEVARLWEELIGYSKKKNPKTVKEKNSMKEEALHRLDSLVKAGYIDSSVFSRFEKDILCGSFVYDDSTPYIEGMNRDYDLYLLAKFYEEELDCLVYHAVDVGRTAYLLTVHREEEEWQHERLDVGTIAALIYSLDEEDYYYDYVAVYNAGGALGIRETLADTQQKKYETEPSGNYYYPLTAEYVAEMKEEAAMRLKDLVENHGVASAVLENWNEGMLCCSCFEEDGTPVMAVVGKGGLVDNVIKEMEAEEGCLVYHVVDSGKLLYLLMVHNDRECWEHSHLKDGIMMLLYCDPKDTSDNFYIDVKVTITDGVISCTELEYEDEETTAETDIAEETEATEKVIEEALEQKTVSEAEEKEEQAEEISATIDGKDRVQWFLEGAEFYNNKKYTNALYAMEKAAQLGDARAMGNMAAMYRMGLGTRADEEKSVFWHIKAAEAGNYSSMFNLSHRYYKGEGVEKDHAKAFYWAEKATENDDPGHWFNLAHKYDNCQGIERDDKKYFYRLERAAQGGVKETFTHCASCYDVGTGTPVDKAKALYWYEKAAETGNTEAMMECFHRYVEAIGTERDDEKATYWLTEACNAGDANALYELGRMYVELGGSEADWQNGYQLLEQAGEKGHVDAMMRLADDYTNPDQQARVEKNTEKGFYWYEKAAQAGNSRAMSEVFAAYFYGVGTERDDEKASQWLWAAIDAGVMEAPRLLTDFYYDAVKQTGDGKYYEFALYWEEIAARGGHEAAKRNLAGLYLNCFIYEYEKEQSDPEKIIKYADGYMETDHFGNMTEQDKVEFLMGTVSYLYKHSEAEKYGEHIISYAETAANLGDSNVMNMVASLYADDTIVEPDYQKSLYWRQKAFDNGNLEVAGILGYMYYEGVGCRQDYEKAFECFNIAAENGDSGVWRRLGDCYYYGDGCQQDYEKAFEYYSLAAENGNIIAKERLTGMYAVGEGCRVDTDKMFALASELAEEGSDYGVFTLGLSYAGGHGCRQDHEKAFSYMRKAAEMDFVPAYYYLGELYETGYGCEMNLDKAFEMYKKAADKGWDEALEKVAFYTRMKEVVDHEAEKTKEIAKKYINSPDPEMRKLAHEILGME